MSAGAGVRETSALIDLSQVTSTIRSPSPSLAAFHIFWRSSSGSLGNCVGVVAPEGSKATRALSSQCEVCQDLGDAYQKQDHHANWTKQEQQHQNLLLPANYQWNFPRIKGNHMLTAGRSQTIVYC